MPRVPYRNRREKVYRALLVATVRSNPNADVPTCDEQAAPYGLRVVDIEPYVPDYDWRQLKYILDCLVREGRVFKTRGRRGIKCRYWPVGGVELVRKDRIMRRSRAA